MEKGNKWEVSISEISGNKIKKYKVTRRMPSLGVAETKMFDSKEKALKQFHEWLGSS